MYENKTEDANEFECTFQINDNNNTNCEKKSSE